MPTMCAKETNLLRSIRDHNAPIIAKYNMLWRVKQIQLIAIYRSYAYHSLIVQRD
jgi:hypothetical protein